ncbi:MAG: pantoate--beta-alanine ligase [Phycisphaerae bacterium]|nr:pantoate--beta-alanine ligase [Phycisphaerae bacterium]
MEVFHTIDGFREARPELGKLALVPTMGALHAGHLSLVKSALLHADHVAVSIFVNPTQFGPREDFNRYPRPIEEDLAKCEEAGVTVIFNPATEEMYPKESVDIAVDLPTLTDTLEGKHRPGHFKGVCQVVAKLFNITTPQSAFFGQKDFQQFRVIQAMVEALDWPIEIIGCPTMRDPDGLALSSRNQYLSADERERALSISRALMLARNEAKAGVRQANRLIATMRATLLDVGNLGRVPVSIDYVAAVDPLTLKNVLTLEGPTVLAIACRVGNTRLIDNVIVQPES